MILSNVALADWRPLIDFGANKWYVDKTTLHYKGRTFELQTMNDWKEEKPSTTYDKKYFSSTNSVEINCYEAQHRLLSYNEKTDHMGYGETSYAQNIPTIWFEIPPQSVFDIILKEFCKKTK